MNDMLASTKRIFPFSLLHSDKGFRHTIRKKVKRNGENMNRREMLKAALVAPFAVLVKPEKKEKEELHGVFKPHLIEDSMMVTFDKDYHAKGYRWVPVSGCADVGVNQGDIIGVVDNEFVKGI